MSNQANNTVVKTVTYMAHRVPVVAVYEDGHERNESFTVPEERARIIFNKNQTIVILDDGSKGVAECAVGDTFNPRVGVQIAYSRAKIISLQKQIDAHFE